MYGIIWYQPADFVQTPNAKPFYLRMAGNDYATLEVWMENDHTSHPLYLAGYRPGITSVHTENGKWVC